MPGKTIGEVKAWMGIALPLATYIGGAAVVGFLAHANATAIEEAEVERDALAVELHAVEISSARQEEQIEDLDEKLDKIDAKLDRLLERDQ